MILLLLLIPMIAGGLALANLSFGGKSGDWIEYSLQESGLLDSEAAKQVRMDFLAVSGTNVTVYITYESSPLGMGTTTTFDLTTQDDFAMGVFFTARTYFIPGGLSQGDSVYLGSGIGTKNITGEATKSYFGVNRGVIYANFTDVTGSNYTLYWDQQTGVLTEGVKSSGDLSDSVMISSTNMWGVELAWLLWISIIVAIALGVVTSRKSIVKRLHKKRIAQNTSPKDTQRHPPSSQKKR